MSGRSGGRHRRQSRTFDFGPGDLRGFAAALPARQHQQMAIRVGTVAASAVVAGGSLLGAAAVGPQLPAGPAAHVQDVRLAAVPTFQESLQALLNVLGVGTVGDLLGKVGLDHEVTPVGPLDTESAFSALLADMNPLGTTLNAATGDILGAPVGALLENMFIGNQPVSDLTIDTLVGDLLGQPVSGAGAADINDLFTALGLGQYSGLVDIIPNFFGTLLNPNLHASDPVGYLLSSLLNVNTSTETLGELPITIGGSSTTLGDADLNQLLGITTAQLNEPWDQFIDNLPTSGILSPTQTLLGDETLGDLLTSLLPHDSAIAPVIDTTLVTDYLDALGLFAGL